MAERREYNVINNFSSGQADRHALSAGPSWRFYKHSLAKAENVLLNRNGGCAKRPSVRELTGDANFYFSPFPGRASPFKWRVIPWSPAANENYEIHLWNDPNDNMVAKWRVVAITNEGDYAHFDNQIRTKNNGSPLGTPVAGNTFTEPVEDISVATHSSGAYFAHGDIYPFAITRRLSTLAQPATPDETYRQDVRDTLEDDELVGFRPGKLLPVIFRAGPHIAAHLGLIDLGNDPYDVTNPGKGLLISGADGTRLPAADNAEYGGMQYTMLVNYLITDGDPSQGKSIYTTPTGIGYNNTTELTRLNLKKQLLDGLIYANRKYACVFNPRMGYPTAVAIDNGRLYYFGHQHPRYASYYWASKVNDFAEFGTHFRLFTADNTTTNDLKEQRDQYDILAATRLPSYGIIADTGVPGTIRGVITGGKNILFHTDNILYEFLISEGAATGNAVQRVSFVDNVSIDNGEHAIIDQAIYILDRQQETLVREKINYLSLPESTNYDPERVSTIKSFDGLFSPVEMSASQVKKFAADLVFVVNGWTANLPEGKERDLREGKLCVYHTATEAGQTVYAAWAVWTPPTNFHFVGVYARQNKVFAQIKHDDNDAYYLCELVFDPPKDDATGYQDVVADSTTPIASELVLPEPLWENADGYFGRFPKGISEVHIDIICSSEFDLMLLPNSPNAKLVLVAEVDGPSGAAVYQRIQRPKRRQRMTGCFYMEGNSTVEFRTRPHYADALRVSHKDDGPFELGAVELVGFANPADLDRGHRFLSRVNQGKELK